MPKPWKPLAVLEAELDDVVRKANLGPEDYEWFDAPDLALICGVAPATVRKWIARGVLAGRRVGNVRSRLRVRIVDWERALYRACAYGDPRTARALWPKGRRA